MTLDLQLVKGIGKKIAERMKRNGIDSISKLASSRVEDLSKIRGIGNSMAKTYIHIAQNYLENMNDRKNEKNLTLNKLNHPLPINSILNTPIRVLDGNLDTSKSYFPHQQPLNQAQIEKNNSKEVFSRIESNPLTSARRNEKKSNHLISREFIVVSNRSSNIEEPLDPPYVSNIKEPLDPPYMSNIKEPLDPPNLSNIKEPLDPPNVSNIKEPIDPPNVSNIKEPLDPPNLSNIKEPLDPPNSINQNNSSIISYISSKEAKIETPHKVLSEERKSKKKKRKNVEKIKKNSPYMNKITSSQKITKKKKNQKTQTKRKTEKVNYLNTNSSQVIVLETKPSKLDSKIKERDVSYCKAFFDVETIQKIRFLHLKIKKIEKQVFRGERGYSIRDLELFHEYITLLNINYKTKNQNLILRELDLTLSYYDPIDRVDINIYDIMFECARTLWVMALFCANLSEEYESEENWESAIVTMVECSKSYKAASYFSGASVNQKNIGSSLNPEYLEFKSEETRILAQSIAALKEEATNNFYLASKLYAGLSALSKRLYYLKPHDEKTGIKIQAQFSYDMGKSCHLIARAIKSSLIEKSRKAPERVNQKLLKANYYYSIAEGLWEDLLQNIKDLTKNEKKDIEENLKIVNEIIMENDVEILDYESVKHIQDPEPIIIVPENLSGHIPKVVDFLRRYPYRDHSVKRLKRFRTIKFEEKITLNKKSELLNRKATLGRLINELKYLYDNNDIDIDKYMELLEKYKTKINDLNSAIETLNIS